MRPKRARLYRLGTALAESDPTNSVKSVTASDVGDACTLSASFANLRQYAVTMPEMSYTADATTLGSLLAFLSSRYVFSKGFRRFLGKRPQLRLLEVIVGSNDWRIVAVMRLGVPIPSFLQNYMFGLTRLSVLPYALATFIFTIPQAVLFVVLGRTGREVLMTEEKSLVGFLPLVLAVASTLVLIVLIARHAKREYESLATEQMVKCE